MPTKIESHSSPNGVQPADSLTRKFAGGAGIIIILTAVFLVHIHQREISDQTDRIAAETNRYVIRALTNGLLDKAMRVFDLGVMADEPRQSHPAYRDLDSAVHTYLAGTPILKVKIYDTAGRTVYSTNPEELGQDYSANPSFKAALAGGEPTEQEYRRRFTAWSGPRQNIWLLSGHMPMLAGHDHGAVIGVIKIYRDLTLLRSSIERLSMNTTLVIAGAFMLLFVLLVTMVWHAERKTQAEHEAKLSLARAMAQAEATAREKTQFLANISHELRTPLNAIIGFAEILGNEIMGPLGHASYKEYIDDIGKSGRHLLNIINEVLDLVKAESGTMVIDAKPTDVVSLANSVSRSLAPEAASFGNTLTVAPIGEIGVIETDAGKLRQVLINIVNNGLKFTPEGGEVRIEIHQDSETRDLVIRVIDNGIGMSADDIPIAQSAFGQVQNVFTRTHKGTGLGLPLSRCFTEILGGAFRIESKPQAGTTVTITLPEKPPPKAASPDGWDAAVDRGGAAQDPGAAAKDRRRSDAA